MKADQQEIRYIFKSDLPLIENLSSRKKEDYEIFLAKKGRGLICDKGFLIYEPKDNGAILIDLQVSDKREGIGTQLLNRLEEEVSQLGGWYVTCAVLEECLEMQLFLKSRGYECDDIQPKAKEPKFYIFKKIS